MRLWVPVLPWIFADQASELPLICKKHDLARAPPWLPAKPEQLLPLDTPPFFQSSGAKRQWLEKWISITNAKGMQEAWVLTPQIFGGKLGFPFLGVLRFWSRCFRKKIENILNYVKWSEYILLLHFDLKNIFKLIFFCLKVSLYLIKIKKN